MAYRKHWFATCLLRRAKDVKVSADARVGGGGVSRIADPLVLDPPEFAPNITATGSNIINVLDILRKN